MKRRDRRLCRTCVSYYRERYGYCTLIGKRIMGHIGSRPCWAKKPKVQEPLNEEERQG